MMKIEKDDNCSFAGTDADSSTVEDMHVCQPIAKLNVMRRLSDMGWQNRCDTFDTYYKTINNLEIVVSRHISSEKWETTLVKYAGIDTDEITINYDSNLEWVLLIEAMLS